MGTDELRTRQTADRRPANTGMRRGEVLGLAWDDVDLDGKRLAVRRTLIALGGEIRESTPKTRRGVRQIALDGATVSALREWRRTQVSERLAFGEGWRKNARDFVFTRADGTILHPENVSKQFQRHAEVAGLPRIRRQRAARACHGGDHDGHLRARHPGAAAGGGGADCGARQRRLSRRA